MRFGHRDRQHAGTPDLRELGDDQLAHAARAGTEQAYRVLWDRHVGAGVAAARRMTAAFDPEDLVQEAYLRIWHALLNGRGPDGPFRPYLYQTLRNIAASWSHKTTEVPLDELPEQVDPQDVSDDVVERSVMMRAFRDLPERWQSVLWYLEIEEMKPREAAPLLGLTPSATAALAYRAREGLRRAWLQAHVNVRSVAPSCQWAVERLGDFMRNSLSRDVHHQVRRHVDGCDACALLVGELDEVSSRLRLVLLPMFLGIPAASAQSVLTGTASAGAAPPSTPGPGRLGVGRLSQVPVQGLVAGLAATIMVGAVVWAAAVALSGPPDGGAPGTQPVAVPDPAPRGHDLGVPDPSTLPAEPTDGPSTLPIEPTDGPSPSDGPAPEPTPSNVDSPAPEASGESGRTPGESPAQPGPDGVPDTTLPPSTVPVPPDGEPQVPPEPVEPAPAPEAPGTAPTEEPPTTDPEEPGPGTDPPTLTSATAPGTVTVFPRAGGTAPTGTIVRVIDAAGRVVNTMTVGDDGGWDLTLDGLGTEDRGRLVVEQRAPGHEATAEPIGPYQFDLPQILRPTDGEVLIGRRELGSSGYTVDVRFDGSAGLHVQAFVDGTWTRNPHVLDDAPLDRVVRGLAEGQHALGLRVVEGSGVEARYGPTVTVTFRVVAPGRAL
ncbi:sigma-70 family RNA polymerase sigma factor [Isoptericola croceus]|uniref:sigma-70 family RNA polymerase sigma factor n=1 Tax=Isoptericola croceus TaxID=3031406 RepID=UPI0023F9D02E|nr:sigma-70 family RNA polymerase sigma factor [Isoptericola croceus]